MKEEKLFQVHRCGWINIKSKYRKGTKHWFSYPLSESKAIELKKKWENIAYKPTEEECDICKSEIVLDKIEYVEVERYREPIDYMADSKMKKVGSYFYKIKDGNVTIFNEQKIPIYKYSGDPHDYEKDGVQRIIEEENL